MSDTAAQTAAQDAAAAARQSTITLWTLYAFGILVTVLRTYARGVTVGVKNLQGDDFLAWLALVSHHASSSTLFTNLASFSIPSKCLWGMRLATLPMALPTTA